MRRVTVKHKNSPGGNERATTERRKTMALAQLANSSARRAKPGATKNKTKRATKNRSAKPRTAQNKTPVRATLGAGAVKSIQQNTRKAVLAELRANGRLTEANKRKTHKAHRRGKRRNGSTGNGLMKYLPAVPNPNFRGIGNTLVTGAAIIGGGGASTVLAALILALTDWVLPDSVTQHRYYQKYGQAVATFVAAVFALPLVLSIRVFNFIPTQAKTAATWGGVGFSLGQGYNELTGGNIFSPDFGSEITAGARNLFPSTGNKQADDAAKAVLQAGGTPAQAAQAAAGTMRGLRGVGGGGLNYTPNRPPMMNVSRAF